MHRGKIGNLVNSAFNVVAILSLSDMTNTAKSLGWRHAHCRVNSPGEWLLECLYSFEYSEPAPSLAFLNVSLGRTKLRANSYLVSEGSDPWTVRSLISADANALNAGVGSVLPGGGDPVFAVTVVFGVTASVSVADSVFVSTSPSTVLNSGCVFGKGVRSHSPSSSPSNTISTAAASWSREAVSAAL